MTIEIRAVSGPEFADSASVVLSAAWAPPALRYSPQYLAWQLSFPGPCEAPAVAAFSGKEPVGFAGSVHRRVSIAGEAVNVLVVTFVAVLPSHQGRGIVRDLYAALLSGIRGTGFAVITFGRNNTSGQRAIEHAYPAANLPVTAFGEYPGYAILPRSASRDGWRISKDVPAIPRDPALAYSYPTEQQFEHYLRDPRGRRLWIHDEGGWAWTTEVEFNSSKGLETVLSLEAVSDVPLRALPGLALSAGDGRLVQAPNLVGYPPQELRTFGFRQTTTPWIGYWAGPPSQARATNLEII